MGYILSIDQGTTGTTAALIRTKDLKFIAKVNKEFPQIFPAPGHVEHDLNDIWTTVGTTITELLTKSHIQASQINTIGITNQRETICAFDAKGTPLHNALVWQDRRTSSYCEIVNEKVKKKITELTGLPLDPYFSGTKMKWLLENSKRVQRAGKNSNLKFGTIDTYILFKLTDGSSYFTEPSNASRTLLYDIYQNKWSPYLCDFFNINKEYLPTVIPSFSQFGKTKGLSFLPDGIPITGILGDQQSALFGQGGIEEGISKCTYGTGAFFLLNTGNKPISSRNGLLSTIAYQYKNQVSYALEGSSYIAGAAVQWLRDSLNMIESSSEIESLAKKATKKSTINTLFLPFFSGLGSPYWVPNAQGAILGLTRDSGKEQIAKACLEGISLSINDLLQSVIKDCSFNLNELRVDGGAVINNTLMQMQANFTNIKIIRPSIIETTAYGAACAAAIGNEIISFSKLKELIKIDALFSPDEDLSYEEKKKILWKKAIKKLYLKE